MEQNELEIAGNIFNEDHAKQIDKKTHDLRVKVDSYREDLLKIIRKNYPNKLGEYVKVGNALDDAFDKLNELAKKL